MKKTLKFFVMAFAALAFMGCPSGQTGSQYTSIKFKEANVQVAQGATTKLFVLYEPATLDAPIYEWASSDTTVAVVDQNGTVYGLVAGSANITAKVGDLEAVCQVEVVDPLDLVVWGGMGLFRLGQTMIGEPYEVETSVGNLTVANYEGVWYAWDENINYDDETGFSGAGFLSIFSTPVEIILEGDYKGAYVTGEVLFTDMYPADSAGVCPAGKLTNAEEWAKYLFDTTYVGDGSFAGAPIHYVDWTTMQEQDFVGYILNGWMGEYSNGFFYQMNVRWLNGIYGLEVVQNAEGQYEFVEPFTFATYVDKYYELMPEKNVVSPAFMPRKVSNTENMSRILDRKNFKAIKTISFAK